MNAFTSNWWTIPGRDVHTITRQGFGDETQNGDYCTASGVSVCCVL